MAVSNAELKVVLSAMDNMTPELKKAQSALAELDKQAANSGKTFAGLGESIGKMTVAAGAIGVGALAVGLGAAVKSASDFEKGISGISAVAGATKEELEGIRQTALQLGKDTSFSATEAAEGMEELIKAGVSLADVMGGGARASLDLAAAGAVSVGEAATITSNAMNAFGRSGAEAAHIADVIAGAANASAIDVHDFGFSLAASGAVANTVGFSFEDLATGIAVMGQAGIKGSDAGTSLKTMMLNLQPATKEQRKLFRELGITTEDGANAFFDATGKVKSMAEVAGVLQKALGGMSEKQRLATLEVLFGSDAIRAGAVLTKAGAEGFNDMAAAMGKVSAQQVAEERLNNLQGSLEKLKGSLETAAIVIGSAFLPALKDITDAATQLVNDNMPAMEASAVAVAEAFRQAVPVLSAFFQILVEHGSTIMTTVALLGGFFVLVTVTGWINATILAVQGLGVAFGVAAASGGPIAGIIALLGGPVVITIAAVVAAIALLALAWSQNWFDIQGKTKAAVEFITEIISSWLRTIQEFWDTHGATILATAERIWNSIKAAIDIALKLIESAITLALAVIRGDWETAWEALKTLIQTAWDAYVTIVRTVGNLIIEAAKAIVQGIIDAFAPNGALQQASNNLVEWLNQTNTRMVEFANTMGPGIVDGIVKGLIRVGPNPFADAISGLLKAAIADVMGRIGSFFPSGGGGGGGGGGEGMRTMSLVSGGGNAGGSKVEKQAYIGNLVRQMGGDEEAARIFQAVTETEGGLFGGVGDQSGGGSYGPFQFYAQGQLQGFAKWLGVSLAEAKTQAQNLDLATQYAFETYLGGALKAGRAQGLTGAALATYVQRYGQVSEHPELTGANYNRMFGSGGGNAAALTEQYRQAQGMVPQFAEGGIVPGETGHAIMALVHGGEAILNPEQIAKVNAALAQMGTTLGDVTGISQEATAAQGEMSAAMDTTGMAADHLEQMQGRLNAVMGQEFPQATSAGATSLRGFGMASQGVVDELLAGNIGLDQAKRLMVIYAASTGLAVDPLQRMNAGLVTQDGALQAVLFAASQVNPAYTETALALQSGAISADTAALNFLQLAASTQGATNAVVPFDQAIKTLQASMPMVNELMAAGKLGGDELTKTLIGLSNSSGLVSSTLDLTTASTAALDAEMMRMLEAVATTDPAFKALSDTILAQGGITDETRNEIVKLFTTYGLAQPSIAPAIAANQALGTSATTMATDSNSAWQSILKEISASVKSIDETVKRLADAVVGYIKRMDDARAQVHVDTSSAVKNLDKLEDKANDAREALEKVGLDYDDLDKAAKQRVSMGLGGWNRDSGGMIPGRLGQPSLGIAHGGEMVLTPRQQAAILNGSIGGGGQVVINVNAPVYGVNDMETVVITALDRANRRR